MVNMEYPIEDDRWTSNRSITQMEAGRLVFCELPLEVVCFVFSGCDGECPHCWSSNNYLGQPQSAAWHKKFWPLVDPEKLSRIKISGGEPLLNPDFCNILSAIREAVPVSVPVIVFSAGRRLISLSRGKDGVEETVSLIRRYGLVRNGVQLHVSIDEYHAAAWLNVAAKELTSESEITCFDHISILKTVASNFIGAMTQLEAETEGSFTGKIKVHVRDGRLAWHRNQIFSWLNSNDWDRWVDGTEGLIDAGMAKKNGLGDVCLAKSRTGSLFIIPGARFADKPRQPDSEVYDIPGSSTRVFLNPSIGIDSGVGIFGWWNLINHQLSGGNIKAVLAMIGKEPHKEF